MGWTGICVEPIPEVFEALKNARQAMCVQGCICSGQDTVSFLRIKGDSEMLSGILNNYDPEHLDRVQKELAVYGGSADVITVKCYDLTNLLLGHGLTHIDYLSVDTEGGELEILKSIDFQSITIDIIDVENNLGTNRFQEFLEPLGYTKVTKLGVDEIYARKQ
jgi:FkbM family methyltransferase